MFTNAAASAAIPSQTSRDIAALIQMICSNPVHFPSTSAPVKGIRIFQHLTGRSGGGPIWPSLKVGLRLVRTMTGVQKSGWFGIDGRTEQWVAGAALSKTWSETDYRVDASSGPQRLRTELTVLYPYGRWALDEQSALHAIAGIGSGEVRNMRDGSVQEKSDLSMRMLSVGVERQLAPRSNGMELSVRAEASTVRLKTEAGDESIDGLTPESWRIRMGLEGSRRISRDDGTVMEPFFDLAVRRDGGDGLEGYGMEAAGGARYIAERVQLEFRGRVLLAHSGRGVRESGLSVTFSVPAGVGRTGAVAVIQATLGDCSEWCRCTVAR